VNLLLDTHVWLWSIASPERIHPDVRELIEDEANPVFLSAASGWEIAIKFHIGKLELPEHPRDLIEPRLVRDRIHALPVEHRHAVEVAGLPDHHRDPFDRLLVVQARIENLALVTADPKLEPYEADMVWADRPLPGKDGSPSRSRGRLR
jgi:PIN domain nuclease of toxin-antitoxin system